MLVLTVREFQILDGGVWFLRLEERKAEKGEQRNNMIKETRPEGNKKQ